MVASVSSACFFLHTKQKPPEFSPKAALFNLSMIIISQVGTVLKWILLYNFRYYHFCEFFFMNTEDIINPSNLSGTPSNPGETNFSGRPPIDLTSFTSLLSIVFSLIFILPCRYLVLLQKCVFSLYAYIRTGRLYAILYTYII